jgi:hypothetical protein
MIEPTLRFDPDLSSRNQCSWRGRNCVPREQNEWHQNAINVMGRGLCAQPNTEAWITEPSFPMPILTNDEDQHKGVGSENKVISRRFVAMRTAIGWRTTAPKGPAACLRSNLDLFRRNDIDNKSSNGRKNCPNAEHYRYRGWPAGAALLAGPLALSRTVPGARLAGFGRPL